MHGHAIRFLTGLKHGRSETGNKSFIYYSEFFIFYNKIEPTQRNIYYCKSL